MKVKELLHHLYEHGLEFYEKPKVIVISNYIKFENNKKIQFDRIVSGKYEKSKRTFTKGEESFYFSSNTPPEDKNLKSFKREDLIKSKIIYELYLRAKEPFFDTLLIEENKNNKKLKEIIKNTCIYKQNITLKITTFLAKKLINNYEIKNIETNINHYWLGYKIEEGNITIYVAPKNDNVYVCNDFVARIVITVPKKTYL